MDKYYILNQVKKIHELSHKYVDYEAAQKKCVGKYCEIGKWLDEIVEEIKGIKSKITDAYKEMFANDMVGKYLIMTHDNDNEKSVFLFHITDIGKTWKSNYFRHDLMLVPLGEYLGLVFNKDGNLIRSKYIQQTDEYDPIGSSYLTSNHYYHLIPESFNGWKETTKEHYDWFIDMYVPKCDNHSNLNFDRIYKDASEVKISGED